MDPILATIKVHIADGYKPLIFNINSHSDYTQQIRIFVQKFCLPPSAVKAIQSQIKTSLQKYQTSECELHFREKLNLMKQKILAKTLLHSEQNINQKRKTNEQSKKKQLNNEDTPINKLWQNSVSKYQHCYKSKICFFEEMKNAQDKERVESIKQTKYSGLTFQNYTKKIGCRALATMGEKINQNEFRQILIFQQKGQKIKNNYTQKQTIQLEQNKNNYRNRYSIHTLGSLSQHCSPVERIKKGTNLILKRRHTQQQKSIV